MNQDNISRTLSRRLETNQYNNYNYNDIFWSEDNNFSFFVYSDNSFSFQINIGYF
jgi:hypothetical protein